MSVPQERSNEFETVLIPEFGSVAWGQHPVPARWLAHNLDGTLANERGGVRTTVRSVLAERSQNAGIAFLEGAFGASLDWTTIASRLPAWDAAHVLWGDEARIGLRLANPLAMASALITAFAAGVTVCPLDPLAPVATINAQAEALQLSAIVTDPTRPLSGVRLLKSAPTSYPVYLPSGRRTALLMPTSGSMGQPKLVPLAEEQILHTAAAVAGYHRLTANDRGYSPLPLHHINGLVVSVVSTLVAGSTMVLEHRFSKTQMWECAARYEVSWCNLVPAIITILAAAPPPDKEVAQRMRFVRSASAPLPDAVRRRFESRTGIGVIETYGMTEAASQITANPCDQEQRRPGSVGRPVDIDLRVVDDKNWIVPPGTIGRVQIRGESVCEEYWYNTGPRPSITDVGGWLNTADLGRLDDDGFLYLVGRADDVINRGGEKVHPREIEEVLFADPQVAAVAVVGRPHEVVGEEPVAFVVPVARSGHADYLRQRLRGLCQEKLARHQQPAEIIVADSLPASATGKIRRQDLRVQSTFAMTQAAAA